MGMTMAEKIFRKNSGLPVVRPGQYITAKIDRIVAAEYIGRVYRELKEIGIHKLWDSSKVIIITDHCIPAASLEDAQEDVNKRKFVKEYGISNWYDVGRGGICHQVMPEKGHTLPGTLVVGMDSHTTSYGAFNVAATAIQEPESYWVLSKGEIWFRVPETIKFEIFGELPFRIMGKDVILKIVGEYGTDVALYKSAEFVGPAVQKMSLSDRWAIANMGVEIGAKFALFEADQKTLDFLEGRAREPFTPVKSDPDAAFEKIYHLDVCDLTPLVACPHDVGNVRQVTEIGRIHIDQGFIGSCTGGRLEDLAVASEILRGRKVHSNVRLIVIPSSMEVYKNALRAGILETLIESDAIVCGPTCGPCAGQHLGILAEGERCISASNRNFKGRMGSTEAEVFLASPATVAASAVAGFIMDPREL